MNPVSCRFDAGLINIRIRYDLELRPSQPPPHGDGYCPLMNSPLVRGICSQAGSHSSVDGDYCCFELFWAPGALPSAVYPQYGTEGREPAKPNPLLQTLADPLAPEPAYATSVISPLLPSFWGALAHRRGIAPHQMGTTAVLSCLELFWAPDALPSAVYPQYGTEGREPAKLNPLLQTLANPLSPEPASATSAASPLLPSFWGALAHRRGIAPHQMGITTAPRDRVP